MIIFEQVYAGWVTGKMELFQINFFGRSFFLLSFLETLHKKIKLFIKDLLRIWSHLLKKSLMENFIFCAVVLEILRSSNQIYI